MAYDRIGKTSANLVAVPPFKIHEVTTDYILKQEVVILQLNLFLMNHLILK